MNASAYWALYDRIYAGKDYAGEADSVLARLTALRGAVPGRILDIGCGTGGHARALAARGARVVGVDTDEAAIARANSGAGGPDFHAGPVSALRDSAFDAAISLFHVVNYIPDRPALAQFLDAIAERLASGAPFLLDCWNGVAVLRDPPRIKEDTVADDSGVLRITTRPTLDAMAQSVTLNVEIVATAPDGGEQRVEHRYRHRLWTPRDLCEHLAAAGFHDIAVSRWMRPGDPATAEDWKIMLDCVRIMR